MKIPTAILLDDHYYLLDSLHADFVEQSLNQHQIYTRKERGIYQWLSSAWALSMMVMIYLTCFSLRVVPVWVIQRKQPHLLMPFCVNYVLEIIYIKTFSPRYGLTIKAIGIVMVGNVCKYKIRGVGVPVTWVWTGEKSLGKIDDKWPVRSVTIYEEQHPTIQSLVLSLLLSKTKVSKAN